MVVQMAQTQTKKKPQIKKNGQANKKLENVNVKKKTQIKKHNTNKNAKSK